MALLSFAPWLPNSEEGLEGIPQLALAQAGSGPALGLVQLNEQSLQLFLQSSNQLLTDSCAYNVTPICRCQRQNAPNDSNACYYVSTSVFSILWIRIDAFLHFSSTPELYGRCKQCLSLS